MSDYYLYPCFRELEESYQNIWFLSDTHFGEDGRRRFTDEELIAKINSVVHRKDVLFLLGDVGTNVSLLTKLKAGRIIVVLGNHDKRGEIKEFVNENDIYDGLVMLNRRIAVSHEPFSPITSIAVNIHGHIHSRNAIVKENEINVCADVVENGLPIRLKDIVNKSEYNSMFKKVKDIHRIVIDRATKKVAKKVKKTLTKLEN